MKRFDLPTLMRVEGFRRVVPKYFDLVRWQAEEQQQREEEARLSSAPTSFNANANDLTLRYVLAGEYEHQLVVAPMT